MFHTYIHAHVLYQQVYQLAGGCQTGDMSVVTAAIQSGVDVNIKLHNEVQEYKTIHETVIFVF